MVKADLSSDVYVGIAITWLAALVSLGMRVIARRMTKVSWWFDDYFCVAAFVSILSSLSDGVIC